MRGEPGTRKTASVPTQWFQRLVRPEQYYVQDARTYVGNSMSWWAKDAHGYCCDIRKAHVWTKAEAMEQHEMRETDVPWPKKYIDKRIQHHIDMQCCDRAQGKRVA